MSPVITITGSTGKVGKTIAEILLTKGAKVKAIARNKNNFDKLKAKGAEAFAGKLEDTLFLIETFKRSDAVFAMLPPCYHLSNFKEVFHQMAASLTEAIKGANISHVVMLSSVGADSPSGNGQISSLYEFESMLKAVPDLSVVALRCAYFMENHLNSIPLIRNAHINGGIIEPDLPVSMIATKDIAAVTSEYLMNPSFSGYNVRYLLGPKDYSFREVTSLLGASIEKPDLMYVKFSFEEFNNGMVGAGFSPEAAEALYEGLTALGKGHLTKNLIRTSSNTTPTTIEEFAREVFVPAYNA
jgi:uncharacterized protein YbjT (DUF2867 family)